MAAGGEERILKEKALPTPTLGSRSSELASARSVLLEFQSPLSPPPRPGTPDAFQRKACSAEGTHGYKPDAFPFNQLPGLSARRVARALLTPRPPLNATSSNTRLGICSRQFLIQKDVSTSCKRAPPANTEEDEARTERRRRLWLGADRPLGARVFLAFLPFGEPFPVLFLKRASRKVLLVSLPAGVSLLLGSAWARRVVSVDFRLRKRLL